MSDICSAIFSVKDSTGLQTLPFVKPTEKPGRNTKYCHIL